MEKAGRIGAARCLAMALVLLAAPALAQTPGATEARATLRPAGQDAYERVRTRFCSNEKVRDCLGLEQTTCEANIEGYIGSCRTQPDPQVAASEDPNFLIAHFSGCAVGGALKANPSKAGSFYGCMVGRPAR